jgi:hypothetical protein
MDTNLHEFFNRSVQIFGDENDGQITGEQGIREPNRIKAERWWAET